MEVCRICDEPSSEMQNIFCKNADGKQILQLIRETLPVVIYRNDPLSKEICLSCLDNVNRIHAFRKSCLKVVDKHRDVLKGNHSKDALLYLQLLDNIDQKELWMYSSPVKKIFSKETPMCFNCKTELFAPKVEKPFKKYKELPRKSEGDISSNSLLNTDDSELVAINSNKRKRLPMLDFESIVKGSVTKRKKIIGPKCVSQPFIRTVKTEAAIYNPLSLLKLVLNVINKSIVPNRRAEHYMRCLNFKEEEMFDCEYCLKTFSSQYDLAKHEVEHMKINLSCADNFEIWNTSFEDSSIRNKWFRNTYGNEYSVEEEEEEEEENLLVPLGETGNEVIGDIELVNTKPMVNGVSLADIPKTERRMYFNKSYVVNGFKRKFCPLCRYTFKDNWAMEIHYFSSACYYTCRYCGIRFNKQRAIFDEHVSLHKKKGDAPTEQVFASKKKNDPIPKVLCDRGTRAVICVSPAHIESPPKQERKLQKPKYEIKSPVIEDEPPAPSEGQNEAYFCRKCYKVFFKLNEFNQHTTACEGTVVENDRHTPERKPQIKIEPKMKYQRTPSTPSTPSVQMINEAGIKVSSTGRPVRNCVKDVKYKDHLDIDIDAEDEAPRPKPKTFDFECVVCHAIFPTMLSRNSHMRVHKNGYQHREKPQRENAYHYNNSSNYDNYEEVVSFKQEQLEPLVEIHETNSEQDIPSNIGAVSITPIPNKRHKTSINPDIMKLVQSNPNITIRSMNQSPLEPQTVLTEGGAEDGVRTYTCSGCSKAFTSKSTLYFHKKHQCEASRYPCPFCKKRFGTESAYSAHIFYSHPE